MQDFRFDRLLSLNVFHPLARLMARYRSSRIPILMYHRISDETEGRHPYYETNTSPQAFARQLQFLREQGYSTVQLDRAWNCLVAGETDKKYVMITFDDGYRDFYDAAFPILSQNGFTATVFVVTSKVNDCRSELKGKECLTWAEVRELHRHGMGIGSHTVSHPELKFLSPKEVDYEIGHSKEVIEDRLGAPVKWFSYPYAFPEEYPEFVKRLEELLEAQGYEGGVSTILGTAQSSYNRFFLPRLPVNTWDDLRFFRAKLEGGYDWLHKPQYVFKRMKALWQRRPAGTDLAAGASGL
jgi:peptidoglycan/xylan/chitin deacetylase (PgdA/CDA1 family)